jgi:hypothetical protein
LLIFLPFLSILTVLLMCFPLSLPTSFSFRTFFLSLHLSFFLSVSFFPSPVLVIIFPTYILITFSPYLFYSCIFIIPSSSFPSISFSFNSSVTYPFHYLSPKLRVLLGTAQEDPVINIWYLHLVFVRRNPSCKYYRNLTFPTIYFHSTF